MGLLRRWRRRALSLLGVLAILGGLVPLAAGLGAPPASAAGCELLGGVSGGTTSPTANWSDMFSINPNGVPYVVHGSFSAEQVTATRNAIDTWNDALGFQAFTFAGLTSQYPGASPPQPAFPATEPQPLNIIGPDTLAPLATPNIGRGGFARASANVGLSAMTFRLLLDMNDTPIGIGPAPGVLDLESLVLHEMGHVLGLAHLEPGSVMYDTLTLGRTNRTLTAADLGCLRTVYAGPSATATPLPPTATATAPPTATSVPPTRVVLPSSTPTTAPPTSTAIPTATATAPPTATATQVPPTPVPPTSTRVPLTRVVPSATPTSVQVETPVVTATAVPPTATSTEVPAPTATAAAPTATATTAAPTATATATDVPVTRVVVATATAVAPTATAVQATSTSVPTATTVPPTSTPLPTATAQSPTATAEPAPSSTPQPSATAAVATPTTFGANQPRLLPVTEATATSTAIPAVDPDLGLGDGDADQTTQNSQQAAASDSSGSTSPTSSQQPAATASTESSPPSLGEAPSQLAFVDGVHAGHDHTQLAVTATSTDLTTAASFTLVFVGAALLIAARRIDESD